MMKRKVIIIGAVVVIAVASLVFNKAFYKKAHLMQLLKP